MIILGLDLGNNTGWSLYNDGVIISGVWENSRSSQSRFEGGGMRYVRFLDNLKKLPRPDRIAFEEVRSHKRSGQRSENVGAAQVYGGYLAILAQWCEKENIPFEGVPVGVIKKRATGKGNANKEKVIQATTELSKKDIYDDNEADAFWLMVISCERANVFIKKRIS